MNFKIPCLDKKRLQTDPLADEVIRLLFDENIFYTFNEVLKNKTKNSIFENTQFPDYVQDYFEKTSILPIWANADLLKRGSMFFDKHAENIILMLSFLSLPYCYANANGAKVLSTSQRIGNQTKKRLYETAQYIFEVSKSNAFDKSGEGFVSIQKVRLMHATIRYYIRKSGSWDVNTFGEPVNQEDLAMTHLSFSFVVLQGLRKIGVSISKAEAEAYLHLWKVISYLMGVDIDLLTDSELEAYKLDQAIQRRQFVKSAEGKSLTNALLAFLEEALTEAQNPLLTVKGFVPSYARFLLGEELANLLEVPPANWTSNLLNILKLSNAFKSIFSFEKVTDRNSKLLLQTIYKTEGKTNFGLPARLTKA
jgi:hypothetical protein